MLMCYVERLRIKATILFSKTLQLVNHRLKLLSTFLGNELNILCSLNPVFSANILLILVKENIMISSLDNKREMKTVRGHLV